MASARAHENRAAGRRGVLGASGRRIGTGRVSATAQRYEEAQKVRPRARLAADVPRGRVRRRAADLGLLLQRRGGWCAAAVTRRARRRSRRSAATGTATDSPDPHRPPGRHGPARCPPRRGTRLDRVRPARELALGVEAPPRSAVRPQPHRLRAAARAGEPAAGGDEATPAPARLARDRDLDAGDRPARVAATQPPSLARPCRPSLRRLPHARCHGGPRPARSTHLLGGRRRCGVPRPRAGVAVGARARHDLEAVEQGCLPRAPVVTLRSRNPSGASAAILSRATAAPGCPPSSRAPAPAPARRCHGRPVSNAVLAPASATSTVVAASARLRLSLSQARDRRRWRRDEERPRHALGRDLAARLHADVAEADRRAGPDGHVRHRRVGDATVTPLTVTPAPRFATLPAAKWSARPRSRRRASHPRRPSRASRTTRSGDESGGPPGLRRYPRRLGRPSPRSVLTVTSRNPVAASGAAESHGDPARDEDVHRVHRHSRSGHHDRSPSESPSWSRSARR